MKLVEFFFFCCKHIVADIGSGRGGVPVVHRQIASSFVLKAG